jgi:hypothetical protein
MNSQSTNNADTATELNATHLYIPRLSRDHSKEDIDLMFHCHRIGEVVSVDFVDLKVIPDVKHNPNLVSAFIAVKLFTHETCKKAHDLKAAIESPTGSYRFYIKNSSKNPDEFWLILNNKKPLPRTERNIHQVSAHADELQVKLDALENTVASQKTLIGDLVDELDKHETTMKRMAQAHKDDMEELRMLLLRNLNRKCGFAQCKMVTMLHPDDKPLDPTEDEIIEAKFYLDTRNSQSTIIPNVFKASETNEYKKITADDMLQMHWNPEVRKQHHINDKLRKKTLSDSPLKKYIAEAGHMKLWNNRDCLEENVDRWQLLSDVGLTPIPLERSVAYHGVENTQHDFDLYELEAQERALIHQQLDATETRVEVELTQTDNITAVYSEGL